MKPTPIYNAALTGVCIFYHDGKKGRPIPIQVRDEPHREELLSSLCNDDEVEGFEIIWDSPHDLFEKCCNLDCGQMDIGRFKEYRKDGWPLCPRCNDDELLSCLMMVWCKRCTKPTLAQCLSNGFFCLNCDWADD